MLTPAGAGHYRVRVHVRGRDTAPDLAVTEPVETYWIVTWPGPVAPDVAHKQTDCHGAP